MMFYLSKIIWLIFNPLNLILLFFFSGLIFKYFKLIFISRFLFFLSFLIFFISCLLPTGPYLNFLLEKDFHSKNFYPKYIDGILILSGSTNPFLTEEHNQINLNGSIERLVESVYLIKKYPNAKIVFSGGSGSLKNPDLDHASVAKKFFYRMSIDTKKIIFENSSRNTFENILFSKKIIKPNKNEKWLLVTSAFHLKRSLAVSDKLGWDLIPYATDFHTSKKFYWKLSFNFLSNLSQFNQAMREFVGLFSYYVMGRSERIF